MIRIGLRHILKTGLRIMIQIMMLTMLKHILKFGQKITKLIGLRLMMEQHIQKSGMLFIQRCGQESTVKTML